MKKTFIAVCLSLTVSFSGAVSAKTCTDALYSPADNSEFKVTTVGIEQNLQGSWFGTNGKDTMMLIFMNNMVGMALNGQQIYGNFSVNGNQLLMRFQNGKSLSYTMNLNGDVLILDNSITLNRQKQNQAPNNQYPQNTNNGGTQGSGEVWGGSQSQTNGGWGNTQGQSSGGWGGGDSSGGAPKGGTWGGNDTGATGNNQWGSQGNDYPTTVPQSTDILNGKWTCSTPQGELNFVFNNGQYICIVNGQQIETGMYRYDQSTGNFNFQITSGQAAGSSGTNRIFVQGNNMSIQFQNGGQMNFVRSN